MIKLKKFIAGAIVVPALGLGSIAVASTYKVQPGDSFWKISQKFNVSLSSLMQANNAKENTVIYPGQELRIYSTDKAKEKTVKNNNKSSNLIEEVSKCGEYLDWWTEVQHLMPRGTDFKVTDFYTGESFMLRRSVGTNHADVETLTAKDTEKVKKIWGGDFSWSRRPVIVEVQGRRIAGSLAAMPHAGNENEPGGKTVEWRSLNYGKGTNLDYVKGNNMHGVMDLHFSGSKGHGNPVLNVDHQNAVKVAAGLK